MSERVYKSEEIDRILKRAIKSSADYSGGITESELLRIASELNISRAEVLGAIRYESENSGFEQAKVLWLTKKKSSFREHLTAYLIINGFLVGMNVLTTGGLNWAIFPILGWGIGLAFDYVESYHPSEEKVEAGARKLMKTNKWKNLFEHFGTRILEEFQKK
ncbi:MAG: 2TM domain-containing protein [Candidatus Kapabacteria bacterium]|jgi:hypothetical protein|nr:2TM domain-containing protein [Candidatus Kapabacteria bacterium]